MKQTLFCKRCGKLVAHTVVARQQSAELLCDVCNHQFTAYTDNSQSRVAKTFKGYTVRKGKVKRPKGFWEAKGML